MNTRSTLPPRRAERLIAGCRLVLALTSLLAIYLDPLEPSRFPELCYSLLIGYSIYSAALLIFAAGSFPLLRNQIATHILDLVFFMVINALTEGPVSPFFVYYIFAIICSALRFSRRALIFTAGASIVAFGLSALYSLQSGSASAFELNRFLIRAAYLVITAVLLTFFASYYERIQDDLSTIAVWRPAGHESLPDLVSELLERATTIFRCQRAILAFNDGSIVAAFEAEHGSSFSCRELPTEIASWLGDMVSSGRGSAAVVDARADPVSLNPELVSRFGIETYAAAWLEEDLVRGMVLFLDRADVLAEDVALAQVLARIAGSRLNHFAAMAQLRRGAVAQERVRLARDLHDSLLQSLTGVALQLRSLPRLMQRDVHGAATRLEDIGNTIASDQRELRRFIEELQFTRMEVEGVPDLPTRVDMLARRFKQQWNLDVRVSLDPSVHHLSEAMRQESYSILSEAVANAAKHANARQVDLSAEVNDRHVVIRVQDDGSGFPFRGRFGLDQLSEMKRGPVTLKERVTSLRGEMIIDSSDAGAKLEIRIPIRS